MRQVLLGKRCRTGHVWRRAHSVNAVSCRYLKEEQAGCIRSGLSIEVLPIEVALYRLNVPGCRRALRILDLAMCVRHSVVHRRALHDWLHLLWIRPRHSIVSLELILEAAILRPRRVMYLLVWVLHCSVAKNRRIHVHGLGHHLRLSLRLHWRIVLMCHLLLSLVERYKLGLLRLRLKGGGAGHWPRSLHGYLISLHLRRT